MYVCMVIPLGDYSLSFRFRDLLASHSSEHLLWSFVLLCLFVFLAFCFVLFFPFFLFSLFLHGLVCVVVFSYPVYLCFYLFSYYYFVFVFVFVFVYFVFLSFNVFLLLTYVCCACRTQY